MLVIELFAWGDFDSAWLDNCWHEISFCLFQTIVTHGVSTES